MIDIPLCDIKVAIKIFALTFIITLITKLLIHCQGLLFRTILSLELQINTIQFKRKKNYVAFFIHRNTYINSFIMNELYAST